MNRQLLKDLSGALQNPAWVCFLWLGLTVGVSFLAVPAIFTAASVDRAQALDSASMAFATLSQAELLMLILLLVVIRFSGRARNLWAVAAMLVLIVLAQSAWLLPELAARAQQIVAGIEPAPSSAHAAYAVLEIAKVIALTALGFHSLARRATG